MDNKFTKLLREYDSYDKNETEIIIKKFETIFNEKQEIYDIYELQENDLEKKKK